MSATKQKWLLFLCVICSALAGCAAFSSPSATPVSAIETGNYGGVLRLVVPRETLLENSVDMMLREPLLADGSDTENGILAGCVANDDNTQFILTLREDMQWSDGHPVTVEDLLCGIEYALAQDPLWLHAAGLPDAPLPQYAQTGENSVTITFALPYPGFQLRLASRYMHYTQLLLPAHAMNTEPEIWEQLPSLSPWVLTQGDELQSVFERNPFYWKKDAAGQRLPYIDALQVTWVEDWQTALTLFQNQETDYYWERGIIPFDMLDQMPDGLRRMVQPADAAYIMMTFGQETDFGKRFYNDKRFRGMLGLYIDRKALSETVQSGYGMIRMGEKQYYYDDTIASILFHELGFDAVNKPLRWVDGEEFELQLTFSDYMPGVKETAEAIAETWRDVGFSVRLNQLSVSDHRQNINTLDLQLRPFVLPVRKGGAEAGLEASTAGWMDWKTVWKTDAGQLLEIAEEARKTWPLAKTIDTAATYELQSETAAQTTQALVEAYCWFFILESNDTVAWRTTLRNVPVWSEYAAYTAMAAEWFYWND